jgi:hypothetical protein
VLAARLARARFGRAKQRAGNENMRAHDWPQRRVFDFRTVVLK